jgi:hypothetical protein
MSELLRLHKEVVPGGKDIILTVAAIIAAYVAIKGLGTWRRQLKGNTEYKLAKNILTAVYELREAISAVRHPFMRYSQEPDLPKEKLKELSAREKNWQALVQVYQKRWEPVPAAKAKLDANLLEAEAVWGRDSVGKITPLNGLIGELLWAITCYRERAKGEAGLITTETCSVSPEGRHRCRSICVYDNSFLPDVWWLVDAVHAEGSAIALQLHHAGRLMGIKFL